MRPTTAVTVPVAVLSMLAACSPSSGIMGGCTAAAERPAETVSRGQVDTVPERESNFVLDVTSNLESPVRVTVHVEDRVALDVRLPGTPSGCAHPPVFSYAYDLPHDEVTVAAVTDQGDRREATLTVGTARQWVVVQVQDGFPLAVDVWDSEPQWG